MCLYFTCIFVAFNYSLQLKISIRNHYSEVKYSSSILSLTDDSFSRVVILHLLLAYGHVQNNFFTEHARNDKVYYHMFVPQQIYPLCHLVCQNLDVCGLMFRIHGIGYPLFLHGTLKLMLILLLLCLIRSVYRLW